MTGRTKRGPQLQNFPISSGMSRSIKESFQDLIKENDEFLEEYNRNLIELEKRIIKDF